MTKSMKRIHKVVIKRMVDESPDTSWLGEYGSRAESEYSIDREHSEDCPRFWANADDDCNCSPYVEANSYQYFNPNHDNYKGLPADEIRKYCRQDYARMESMNNGDFCFIGIRADAEVSLCRESVTDACWTVQTITSGGLWGIESDSSPEYLKEIEDEQLSELREQLKAIGFSSRAISAAFKTIEREEN